MDYGRRSSNPSSPHERTPLLESATRLSSSYEDLHGMSHLEEKIDTYDPSTADKLDHVIGRTSSKADEYFGIHEGSRESLLDGKNLAGDRGQQEGPYGSGVPENSQAQGAATGMQKVSWQPVDFRKRTRDEIKKRNELKKAHWTAEEREERRGRVACYCTATAYRMEDLYQTLNQTHKAQFIREVIHVALYENGGDIFYFPFGVLVCWGLRRSEERRGLEEVRRGHIEDDPLPMENIMDDDFRFVYHESNAPLGDTGPRPMEWVKILRDEIVLPNCKSDESGSLMGPGRWGQRTQDLLYKLSFSYALAVSVKLDHFEESIKNIIAVTRPLPEEMARKGHISLTRKEMSQRIGRLFLHRSMVNLHSEVLDTPEFFWEFPELEPIYLAASNYLNIRSRVEILNKRLDVCKEMLEILNDELQHRHSSSLEWIVIWLIVIEVVITLATEGFRFLQDRVV